MSHIIQVFVQWVSHKMDAHWRRKNYALMKRRNLKAAELAHKVDNCGQCGACLHEARRVRIKETPDHDAH